MKKLILGAVVASALVLGCGGGKSIDGKWNVKSSAATLPAGTTINAEFSGGKNMFMVMDIKQPIPGSDPMTIHVEVKGTYEIAGEKMTMKADDVQVTSKDVPANLKATIDSGLKTMGTQLKDTINKEGVTKFAWVDDNTFTLTGASGKPETYTRAN